MNLLLKFEYVFNQLRAEIFFFAFDLHAYSKIFVLLELNYNLTILLTSVAEPEPLYFAGAGAVIFVKKRFRFQTR